MKIHEFLKDQKNLEWAAKCKDIDEFKKFVDENEVSYFTEEQLEKAWNYVKACFPSEDGSLDDEALGVVAGGGPFLDPSLFDIGGTCFPSSSQSDRSSDQDGTGNIRITGGVLKL